MKILVAPDKFKGTLTSPEAAELIARAFREKLPQAEIREIPLADGGDGTAEALTKASGGIMLSVPVRGPLGKTVTARCGRSGNTFFMEMASASGLALLRREELDVMHASTFGTGELIRFALDQGAEEILLGIGGSATCDGGAGMAEALGFRFCDESGAVLEHLCGENLVRIAKADFSQADPRLRSCRIRIASDVTNPLLGENGTVRVYSEQKGATPAMMPLLEKGLARLAEVLNVPLDRPGDGAAGGLGYGLRVFCGGQIRSGASIVMNASGFLRELENADLVITGEGCTDSQTESGKICSAVAEQARKRGVKCLLLSGGVRLPRRDLRNTFDAVLTAGIGRKEFADVLNHAGEDLYEAALTAAELIAAGEKR